MTDHTSAEREADIKAIARRQFTGIDFGVPQPKSWAEILAFAKVVQSRATQSAPPAAALAPVANYVDIIFDGPPSHESGRFVEVESPAGHSINFGEWIHRDDGYWVLRFAAPASTSADAQAAVAKPLGRAWERRYGENLMQPDLVYPFFTAPIASALPTAQPPVAIYQRRKIGRPDWEDVSREKYADVEGFDSTWERRIVYATPLPHPAPVAIDAVVHMARQQWQHQWTYTSEQIAERFAAPLPQPDVGEARDAARYRWLRENGGDLIGRDRGFGPEYPYREELDRAVDLLLASPPTQHGKEPV